MSRYKAREKAFLLLFEAGFKKDEDVDSLIGHYYEMDDASTWGDETQYFEDMVRKVSSAYDELDEKIKNLSIGWKIDRISRVARVILYIALYEIDQCEDIPMRVSINEAVELAKKYDTQDVASFINGILATYVHKEEPEDIDNDTGAVT